MDWLFAGAGLLISGLALWVAVKANAIAKNAVQEAQEANRIAEEANRLSAHAVRVTKLPTLEPLYSEFIALLPRLREPDEEAVETLYAMEPRIRLLGRESLYPPYRALRSVARRVWEDSEGKSSPAGTAEIERRRKQELPNSINAFVKALEDFTNE